MRRLTHQTRFAPSPLGSGNVSPLGGTTDRSLTHRSPGRPLPPITPPIGRSGKRIRYEVRQVHRSGAAAMTRTVPDLQGLALAIEGSRLLEQSRFAEAESALREALALNDAVPEELGRLTLRQDILEDLGQLCRRTGRWAEAVRYMQDSLTTTRRLFDLQGMSFEMAMDLVRRHKDLGTANLEWALRSPDDKFIGRTEAAVKQFQIAVQLISELWVKSENNQPANAAPNKILVLARAEVHHELARYFSYRGSIAASLRQYDHAIGFFQSIQAEDEVAWCLVGTADLQMKLGDLATAERLLHQARRIQGAPAWSHTSRRCARRKPIRLRPLPNARPSWDGFRHAVRAVLEAGEYRLDLQTEQNRLTWHRQVASPISRLAFSLAEKVGDPRAMADLITVSRLSGILELADIDLTDAAPELTDRNADSSGDDPASSGAPPGDGGSTLIAGSSTLIGLGLDALFRRRPVPPIRMPDGRIALGAYTDGPPSPGEVIRYA